MDSLLARSYYHCTTIARKRARNFYYAFRLLPPEMQQAICAIYAFMRYCDDISDEPGTTFSKKELLNRWQDALDRALKGDYGDSLVLPAFHHSVEQFQIPSHYFYSLIDGARMDLEVDRYKTFPELYTYCYRVASVVGLVCIHIFGFKSNEAIHHAERVGVAFQLTNILRDLKEDAGMGRIYLPQEDLRAYHYTEDDLLASVYNKQFCELMKFQVSRAKTFYEDAPQLIPMVHPTGRGGLAAMINIYRGILDRIESRDFEVFSSRVELSLHEKIRLAGRGWLSSPIYGGLQRSKVS
jgi:phytoene synthase